MTDLQKLKSILDNQAERGIKSGDWKDLSDFRMEENNTHLVLNCVQVAFCFTKNGRLIGMGNLKD